MDREKDDLSEVPCGAIAADSTFRIASAGAIWGLTTSPHHARKKGLTGFSKASYVAKTTGSMGLQCGLFAGIYSVTHCAIQDYRMKKDWLNASIAGAVTGAAFAVRTPSRMGVLGMSALVSAITTAAELSTAFLSPPG